MPNTRKRFARPGSRRIGFEMKFSEAPKLGKALYNAVDILELEHLYVVCPTHRAYPINEHISVLPAASIPDLANNETPPPLRHE